MGLLVFEIMLQCSIRSQKESNTWVCSLPFYEYHGSQVSLHTLPAVHFKKGLEMYLAFHN